MGSFSLETGERPRPRRSTKMACTCSCWWSRGAMDTHRRGMTTGPNRHVTILNGYY
jgi:hypothetical protein